MIISKTPELLKLYQNHEDCVLCNKIGNKLNHIFGLGQEKNPRFLLLLINPTYRNVSSNPESDLYQVPFVGVKGFYQVLANAGLISDELIQDIRKKKPKDWDNELISEINQELIDKQVYITNLVKCCFDNPDYPAKDFLELNLELLKKELEVIRPENVITMGAFPHKILTGENIKLDLVYKDLVEKRKLNANKTKLGLSKEIMVLPCYFPVGRGNPKRAGEMIRKYYENND